MMAISTACRSARAVKSVMKRQDDAIISSLFFGIVFGVLVFGVVMKS